MSFMDDGPLPYTKSSIICFYCVILQLWISDFSVLFHCDAMLYVSKRVKAIQLILSHYIWLFRLDQR